PFRSATEAVTDPDDGVTSRTAGVERVAHNNGDDRSLEILPETLQRSDGRGEHVSPTEQAFRIELCDGPTDPVFLEVTKRLEKTALQAQQPRLGVWSDGHHGSQPQDRLL